MIHAFRSHIALSLLAGVILSFTLASAQSGNAAEKLDPGPFYGFWEFQEPAGDTCVLIIKRGGRMSCFWAGTSTRAIEKGSWERSETALTAVWDTGRTEVFKMLGDNAIERATYEAGKNLIGEPALVIRGVRIDPRIPGSLTIKQEKPREIGDTPPAARTLPANPLNSTFIGFWKIKQSTGLFGIGGGEDKFYVNLARNGEATVSLRDWEGDKGVRGSWKVEGKRAIITWPNNRRDVIQPDGEAFAFGTYKKKDALTDKARGLTKAEKVPATEGERYFEAGNFKKLTVLDIRGTWVPQESTGKKEYISIEGWGNAYRYPAVSSTSGGTDPGKWRLDNDRVLITWIDGSKDIIRLSIPHFIQDSFSTDEPMTGKPHRSVIVLRTKNEE